MTALLGGCGWLKAHIYRPVPVATAVGDSVITLGGKKVHFYRTSRYVVFGPTAAAVSTGASHLDRAYFEWTRYFGVAPARLALVLFDRPDTIATRTADSLHAAGFEPLTYIQPKDPKDFDHPYEDVPKVAIWPVSGAVAGELLAVHAANVRAHAAPPPGEAVRDSLLDLYPAWFRGGVAGLLADPAAPDRAFDLLHDRGDQLVALKTLLTSRRFDVGDTVQRPSRELSDVVNAEGLAFLLFATEREGPLFVGHVAEVMLSGGTAATALRDAKQMPHSVDDVERIWRKWLDQQ